MILYFFQFWFSWRHQIKEFSHDYHVVAVDLRGFGETDRPPNILDYSITNLRQDIVELIPSLGHSKAILVAHDWGGAIAWTITQKHPELVEKLVVMNCPHPKIFAERIRHFSQMMKSWYMFLFQIPWLPEFILSVKDFVNFNEFFRGNSGGVRNKASFTEEDVEAYKYVFSQEGAITPPLNYYRAAMRSGGIGTDNEDDSTINVPTLIIWGDADKYFDVAMANDHGGVVSKLTVRHIPDCSHWVQNDVPETVHRYMWEFL